MEPDKIIPTVVKTIIGDKKLGVVVPLAEQVKEMNGKFNKVGLTPMYADVSPYTGTKEQFLEVGKKLSDKVDYILMDCMGYNEEWKT